MVTSLLSRRASLLATLLGTALILAVPAAADSVLEKMQDEIATIAVHTRSAVVTIEDGRLILPNGAAGNLDGSQRFPGTPNRDYTAPGNVKPTPPPVAPKPEGRAGLNAPQYQNGVFTREFARVNTAFTAQNALPKSGTGFSIGNGYIVTTADVVEGMQNPVVITDSGARIVATLVGVNTDVNVGLLKLTAKADIPALTLGDSDSVKIGHFAITVGNQGGQDNSVALSLIGGIRDQDASSGNRYYPRLIQIAGTVGAGISGAPLVNARGEVIGMMVGAPYSYWTPLRSGPSFGVPSPNPRKRPGASMNKVPVLGDLPLVGRLFQSPKPSPEPGYPAVPGADVSPDRAPGAAPPIDANPPGADDKGRPEKPGSDAVEATPPAAGDDSKAGQLAPESPVPTEPDPPRVLLFGAPAMPGVAPLAPQGDDRQPLGTGANPYIVAPGQPLSGDLPRFLTNSPGMQNLWNVQEPVTSAGYAVPINDLKPTIEELRTGKHSVRGWIGIVMKEEDRAVVENGFVRVERTVKIDQVFPDSPAAHAGVLPGSILVDLNGKPVTGTADVREVVMRLRPGDRLSLKVQRPEGMRSYELKIDARPANPRPPAASPDSKRSESLPKLNYIPADPSQYPVVPAPR